MKISFNIFIIFLFILIFGINTVYETEAQTQVNQLTEINGIDNDGTNWWVSATYNGNWNLYKVASDRSTILASYYLPHSTDPLYIEHISAVAYQSDYLYVHIHPSGPIYKVDPSDGSYTTSPYSTRIWTLDITLKGSTLWQTRDQSGGNYEVYSSSGDEFTLTEIPGRKSITSDGMYLYIGDYGNQNIYKVNTTGQILDSYTTITNRHLRLSYLSSENSLYSYTHPSTDGVCSIVKVADISEIKITGTIAFSSNRDDNREIYIMGMDGSNPVNLTNNTGNDRYPDWSPDGSKIVFISDRDGNFEVYIMDKDGLNQTRLTNTPENESRYPVFSPDGSKIVFTSSRDGDEEIYIMDTDGSNQIRLTNYPERDAAPSWSPDGKEIAFVSNREGNLGIFAINITDRSIRKIINTSGDDNEPHFSPDGNFIVFCSNIEGDENWEIYVMNADGSNQIRLTFSPENSWAFSPRWTADGSQIVFETCVGSLSEYSSKISIMNADGSNPLDLTDLSTDDYDPEVSPVEIAPEVTLLSPNGGEEWTTGTTHDVMWTSTNVTNVKIEYSANGGSSWSTIITSTSASVGSYSWIIPDTPSTNCLIKISDASNAAVADHSNDIFNIIEDVGPTQVSQLTGINGIDNDGTYWWLTGDYNGTRKLRKVSSDRNTIIASYDLPYTPQVHHIQEVACLLGYVYVRIHPSGPIYKVNPSDGSYTTSSYSTRIWNYDMTFMGSTLWQTLGDDIGHNYEIYSSIGTEFNFTEVPGWKSITSDGTYLYLLGYGHDKIYKVTTTGQILDIYTAMQANQPQRISYLSSENAIYSHTTNNIIKVADLEDFPAVVHAIEWTRIADLPGDQHVATAQVIDGYVYMIGGQNPPGPPNYNKMRIYDPYSNSWSDGPSMPTRRYLPGSGVIDYQGRSELYVVGGYSGYAGLSTVERYVDNDWATPGDGSWETAASISERRGHGIMCTVVNNNLYAIGGFLNGPSYYNTNQMYDRENNKWVTKASLPYNMQAGQPAVWGGKIYIFGGHGYQINYDNATLIYDPDLDEWSYGADVPHTRVYGSAACVGDYIYLIANTGQETNHNIIDVYHPATDTWFTTDDYPGQNASYPNIAQGDNKIYVMGSGYNEPSKLECWVGTIEGVGPGVAKLAVAVPDSAQSGDSFWVEINAQEVENLFGASFVLNYTNGEFIKMVSPEAGDFLGDDILFYADVDEEESKISAGISRKAGQGEVNGSGVLMRVRFTSGSDTPYGTVVGFSLSEITANDEDGTPLSLRGIGSSITIITKSIPVWPGDTNNDGLVDQTDVLPIGTYWAKTGPARLDGSYRWEAQICQSWYPEDATYADATGDGIVNQGDVLPIGLNWNKTHAVPKIVAFKAVNASGTIKPFSLFEPPINAGDEFWVEIQVEDVNSLFGLSFVLTYDNNEFIEPVSAESGTFMGENVVFFPNIDKDADEVAVGITRKTGQGGVSGSGTVIKIKLKMLQNLEDGSVITFFLNDVVANDQSGAGINLTIGYGQIGVGVLDELSALPRKFSLSQNYPNPFNPLTSIEFAIPVGKSKHVRLNIYDLRGALVRTLVNEVHDPGVHSAMWDGTDETGNKVSSGVYIYKIQADKFSKTHKMLLIK